LGIFVIILMKRATSWIFVGTFERVLECWDRETREYVAIKVVRSIRKYNDAAMIEIDVLNRLAENEKYRSL
jgi:dual-specificity kinase